LISGAIPFDHRVGAGDAKVMLLVLFPDMMIGAAVLDVGQSETIWSDTTFSS
jgi:hypothetical protein